MKIVIYLFIVEYMFYDELLCVLLLWASYLEFLRISFSVKVLKINFGNILVIYFFFINEIIWLQEIVLKYFVSIFK